MAMMDHPNIVRLYGKYEICVPPTFLWFSLSLSLSLSAWLQPFVLPYTGICVSNPILLVMEIAHLGPLNKFLRRHP